MNEWRIKLTDRVGKETWVENPKGCYLADPFLDRDWLYCEKYDRKKGVIVRSKIDDLKNWETVIEEDYHVSFPTTYDMGFIVESGINNTIDCHFLNQKGKYNILSGVCAADPIVYSTGFKKYLFFTNSGDDNLEIWKNDGNCQHWEKIYTGIHKYSRSAGKIWTEGGKIYRPVQVNDPHYGYAIMIKEITLEPYTEKVVHEILPDEGSIGIHTINFNYFYTVTDHKYKI